MSREEKQFIEIFTTFVERFTQGIEALEYKGKPVGTGIFLLNYIGKHPNCSMSEIIKFLNLIPSAATRRVDKLVKIGLVNRTNDEEDRRIVNLNLSKEGIELYKNFFKRRLFAMEMMKKVVDPKDLKIFFKVLKAGLELDSKIKEKQGFLN
ncbi:MAG: MarR family transcriptional regulator [Promethearchaeota archaeon]|nr:MAG: MarR family transcriptional regulator [Candidatus Lokiarchaeota archaeon]